MHALLAPRIVLHLRRMADEDFLASESTITEMAFDRNARCPVGPIADCTVDTLGEDG